MNQINKEQKKRYISEMALALVRDAIEPQLSKDGFIIVLQYGMLLCKTPIRRNAGAVPTSCSRVFGSGEINHSGMRTKTWTKTSQGRYPHVYL
jgi:hypothetical protein